MVRWTEVADEVFQRRYQPLDVTVGVVRAADGLLVVDTRSSHREADEIRTDLAAFKRPVLAVVNTHAHYDHCFGNHRVGPDSDLGAPIYGHERMPAHLATYEAPLLAGWIAEGREPATAWREVVITPPSHLVGAQATLDLGDRTVELLHLGRGHTDNDLVVHVPDAATWLVGDLLEESGPPMYGSGSFPLDWPGTVGALRHAATATATLVPGHGARRRHLRRRPAGRAPAGSRPPPRAARGGRAGRPGARRRGHRLAVPARGAQGRRPRGLRLL